MRNKTILILSHRGQSFLSEWASDLKKVGIAACVLSSAPKKIEASKLIETFASQFKKLKVVENSSLTKEDVTSAIQEFSNDGIEILACASVWEGYRQLVAEMNQLIGAPDLSTEQVLNLRDKYKLRKNLQKNGLSRISTQILQCSSDFENKKSSPERKFIKPRFGIASFGAFPLESSTNWQDVQDLRLQMQLDADYSSFFEDQRDLLLEDWIDGKEFSFEVLAGGGLSEVVALHEKLEVMSSHQTTLEPGCVSPPISISGNEIVKGIDWIKNIFRVLQIGEGAFHAEARFDGMRWEVIEINPRIGGAFISQSAALVSQGISLLSTSAQLLLERDPLGRRELIFSLGDRSVSRQLERPNCERTFFRVFFAEPGRVISNIRMKIGMNAPVLSKVFLNSGEKTPDSSREVFGAQALWKLSGAVAEFEQFEKDSRDFYAINYEEGNDEKSLSGSRL